jgi:hypothetical protein
VISQTIKMDSQTSADANDIINQFDRSCSCSNLSDTTFGVSNGCCAKDIVEKLMVQLKEKDERLEANKIQLEEKNKELEANKEEIKVFEFYIILTKIWISELMATRQKKLKVFKNCIVCTSVLFVHE